MAAKTGKLTNTEKFAIQGMVNEGKDLDFICSTLERKPKMVNDYLATIAESQAKIQKEAPKLPTKAATKDEMLDLAVQGVKAKDMFAHGTGSGREPAPGPNNQVFRPSVMTPGASQMADVTKSDRQGRASSAGSIYKIKEDRID